MTRKGITEDVSVLFTDVVSSTEYFKKYGDEKGREMLKLHAKLVYPYVVAFGGMVVKTIGDSVMACFKEAKDALSAAILIQEKMEKFRTENSEDKKIHVRIGIDYGKAIVEETDLFGNVVNIAFKLTERSDVDGILISEAVFFKVNKMPSITFLKKTGILENISAYEVLWEKGVKFDFKKKVGILVSFFLPREKEKEERPPVMDNIRSLSLFEDMVVIDKNSMLLVPKKESPIERCLEEIGFLLNSYFGVSGEKGLFPPRIVIDLFCAPKFFSFDEKGEVPWHAIAPGEIFICLCATEFIHGNLLIEENRFFTITEERKLYRVKGDFEKSGSFSCADFRTFFLSGEKRPCFYCGDKRHSASECPSKNIMDLSPNLEEIGYFATEEIERAFFTYLSFGPKNSELTELEKASGFDELLRKIHLAFFEPKKIFQLRFLRSFIDRQLTEWEEPKNKLDSGKRGGFLWIAIDLIRVSDYEKAIEILRKAEEEKENPFYILCLKGIYHIEKNEDEKAKNIFRVALREAKTAAEKIYSLFFLMRLSFVCGETKEALTFLRQIIDLGCASEEISYFDLIFRLYKSKLFENQIHEHIKRLIALIKKHRVYYLYVLFDPELAPFFSEILKQIKELTSKTKKEAEDLLLEAERCYFREEPLLLSNEMEEFRKFLEQARNKVESNSYYGFLDSIDISRSVIEKLTSIRKKRMEEIESTKASLKKRIKWIQGFFEEYPLRFLTKRERELAEVLHKRFKEIENENSFLALSEAKDQIEKKLSFLEKKAIWAEKTLERMRLAWSFSKLQASLFAIVFFVIFVVSPLFAPRIHTILDIEFVQLQKLFFTFGLSLSLMISFYFAIRRKDK